jgi:hypothetical protein
LVKMLTYLFSIMLRITIVPHLFNVGIIKPIIEDASKATDDVSNLRPIMISDVMATVFESLLLKIIDRYLSNNDKQFGFKKASSCNHAAYVVLETIKYSMNRKHNTCICGIDASKAFDKVDRDYLWHKMLKNVPTQIVKVVKSYYDVSLALVQNNGIGSSLFRTQIGVKQGGALSPRLFGIYIEDLISQIKLIVVGVRVNGIKIDILLYADDIILISDGELELQKMINEVESFGHEWEIKFNPAKTVYMTFSCRRSHTFTEKLEMNGLEINSVKEIRYLGIYVTENLDYTGDYTLAKKRQGDMIAMSKIKKSILKGKSKMELKRYMYKIYCRPVLYYGLEVLNITNFQAKNLQIY